MADTNITHDSIGGSLASWIVPGDSKHGSRSKYGGPHDAWRLLTKRDPGPDDNENMRRGRVLEDAVVRWVQKHGPDLSARDALDEDLALSIGCHWGSDLVQHPNHPSIHARPDRPLYDGDRLCGSLEIKTFDHTHRALNLESYLPQQEHYACVLADSQGAASWTSWIAVLVCNTGDFTALVSVMDAFDGTAADKSDFMADIIEAHPRAYVVCASPDTDEARYREHELPYLVKWFADYVTADVSPPVDSSRSARATILEQLEGIPDDASASTDTDPELVNKAMALMDKRITIKGLISEAETTSATHSAAVSALKKEYGKTTAELMDALVGGGVRSALLPGENGGQVVTVRARRAKASFNRSRFEKEQPKVFEQYRTDGAPYVVLTVKRG